MPWIRRSDNRYRIYTPAYFNRPVTVTSSTKTFWHFIFWNTTAFSNRLPYICCYLIYNSFICRSYDCIRVHRSDANLWSLIYLPVWRGNWLITLNTSKTKLATFHHRRSDAELPMDGCSIGEATCLERLLSLKLTLGLKWISYIRAIANDAVKMVGLSTWQLMLSLYVYKSQN